MVFRRIFGKDKEEAPKWDEPTLATLAVGCILDFDLTTWEVIAKAKYDYDGFYSNEWTLLAEIPCGFSRDMKSMVACTGR